MDDFGHHSDTEYRNIHRAAEAAYLRSDTDFSAALTREVGEFSRAADADKTDAPMYLIEQLTQMCRDYIASELSAYGDFLVRKGIPHSQGADELEEYAKKILDDVHRRKWNYGIKQISEFFDCESLAKMGWMSVEGFGEAYLREIAEPKLLISDFTPSAQVMEPSNAGETLKDSSERLAVSNGAPGSAGSAITFWQSLRLGFTQMRADCAIDPPLKPAGRLTAIWTTPPEAGKWRLDHRDREDGAGVARRFEWHAQAAAAHLGFTGSGEGAVSFWLDRIKGDAPEAYVRKFTSTDDAGVDRVCMVEIFDICGLSAEYCGKWEADEARWAADEPSRNAEEPASEPQEGEVKINKSDPRTWSPSVQAWEAHKAMKQVLAGPRERIPESVLRNIIARDHGMKPEHVSWKMMQHELTGMLSYYGAIELVPSAPVERRGAQAASLQNHSAGSPELHGTGLMYSGVSNDLPKTATAAGPDGSRAMTAVPEGNSGQSRPRPENWEDVELSFVGDHDVEIRIGDIVDTLNYKQIEGFEDRRTGKPSQLWAMVRVFGTLPDGTMPDDARTSKDWIALQKKIERTSKALRKYFRMTGDPFPYVRDVGYHARIKIKIASPPAR